MICCEIFVMFAAGSLAFYFHQVNKKADRDKDIVLEGHEGFRYTV